MSLADNGIIIPNTTGVLETAKIMANEYTTKAGESGQVNEDIRNKKLADYIRNLDKVHFVLQNRINGVPLRELVDPARISNEQARIEKQEIPEKVENNDIGRVYESWFNDRG